MSKVFFGVVISLDRFIAPDGMDMEHAVDPSYKGWLYQWLALQSWVFQQRFFRENLRSEKVAKRETTTASSKKRSIEPA